MTKSLAETLVCVVDDDTAVRSSIEAVVMTLGCAVVGFSSAEDFLRRPAADADFLIVDVRLPGISGVELLEQLITEEESTPPAAVMTGHADAEELSLDFWPSKVSVLPKPCPPDQLLAIIREALPG